MVKLADFWVVLFLPVHWDAHERLDPLVDLCFKFFFFLRFWSVHFLQLVFLAFVSYLPLVLEEFFQLNTQRLGVMPCNSFTPFRPLKTASVKIVQSVCACFLMSSSFHISLTFFPSCLRSIVLVLLFYFEMPVPLSILSQPNSFRRHFILNIIWYFLKDFWLIFSRLCGDALPSDPPCS